MRRWLLLSTIFLCFAGMIRAQGRQTLTYGELVSGSIGGDTAGITYTFEGRAGDSIYITMYAPNHDLETEIHLITPGGNLLGRDDGSGITGALIGPVTLEVDGSYSVLATRPDWGADSEGEFRLLVDRVTVTPLQLEVSRSGYLPEGIIEFFTLDGEEGSFFRFRLDGSAVGVQILTPGGERVVSEGMYDNFQSPVNRLPETGTYTLRIQTINSGGTDYNLTMTPVEITPLAQGQTVSGSMLESKPPVFSFESAGGKMWKLSAAVEGMAYASRLMIFNGNNLSYAIVSDDASGPNGFPRIDPFIAPENATYYVVLMFDDRTPDDATRGFELAFSASTLLSLSPGRAIEGEVTPESGNAVYAYSGQENEVIRVTLTQTSEEGWAGIGIRSLSDQLMYLTNYGSVRSSTFEIVLPVTGLYLFEVNNQFYEPSSLTFSLLIEQVPS